ncbi:FAD-dependent oxidoreductase [Burkholderia glumae]|uniref:FAD-dependent oxidoreductase n=2 Tax=Burkholderia glumae TaxID=337 RepID=A0AAP9Y5D7_BURGL|nr:FAD-dependent oxidoreductase [Burkholderia glumae]ACR32717.1 D-amino acid oxidase Aao_1 [Burkholderia glumae BGR1]AJY62532.1 FAD dependent oxidoreductase family protein [Burkholderia glumae LMG 2196 = ATCC 33617]PNL04026.1 FAD-binding oxidoreductase [Burkholderia glumae]QGA41869.1 FAD-dependent oxidoreductase [Burkholderia glumae]QKM57584.1 putative D-amino-acid oxidase [Burkholderia glumae]
MREVGEKGRALVIGAGVAGQTTALCLHERGIHVTVVGEKFAPNITSVVAGALWEWPPAVCGYHHDEISLERSKQWCMASFRKFEALAADPATGVYIRPVNFYFRNRIEEHALHLKKMNEIRQHVPGFRRDPALIRENGVNPGIGLVDAYCHLAPMVDTDVYMAWLMDQMIANDIPVIQQRIEGELQMNEARLKADFGVDAIVNCAGLGAAELSGEPMYPLRGAVIRLVNDGSRMPRLDQAHCVSHDHVTGVDEIVFIVPRGEDRIVLGAIAEADEWGTDIGFDNHEPIRRMYRRGIEFMPALANAEIDPGEPVRVGLRPFSHGNVRLEAVSGTHILHNYAHGGAGVTLSWGCALEAAERVENMLSAAPDGIEQDGRPGAHANDVRVGA